MQLKTSHSATIIESKRKQMPYCLYYTQNGVRPSYQNVAEIPYPFRVTAILKHWHHKALFSASHGQEQVNWPGSRMSNELMISFMLMLIVCSMSFPFGTRNTIFNHNILFPHIPNKSTTNNYDTEFQRPLIEIRNLSPFASCCHDLKFRVVKPRHQ
jgi:hypothetical protein